MSVLAGSVYRMCPSASSGRWPAHVVSTYDGYRPDTGPNVLFLLAQWAETTHDAAAAEVWSDVASILSRTDA